MKTPEPPPVRVSAWNYAALVVVAVLIALIVVASAWRSAHPGRGPSRDKARFGPGWSCTGVPEKSEVCTRDGEAAPARP